MGVAVIGVATSVVIWLCCWGCRVLVSLRLRYVFGIVKGFEVWVLRSGLAKATYTVAMCSLQLILQLWSGIVVAPMSRLVSWERLPVIQMLFE